MIEEVIIAYLSENLAHGVYAERPEQAPDAWYIVEKVGSGMENYLKRSTLAVRSNAGTLADAADMNEAMKDVMIYGAITLPEISGISLNSDYNNTDPEDGWYQYQAVFDIYHY